MCICTVTIPSCLQDGSIHGRPGCPDAPLGLSVAFGLKGTRLCSFSESRSLLTRLHEPSCAYICQRMLLTGTERERKREGTRTLQNQERSGHSRVHSAKMVDGVAPSQAKRERERERNHVRVGMMPGVLTDPFARERERERETDRQRCVCVCSRWTDKHCTHIHARFALSVCRVSFYEYQ